MTTFIGKLGPGQKVSRQILGTPYRGDVKIGFNFFVNFMEVTVFEAKDLINVKETKTKLPGMDYYKNIDFITFQCRSQKGGGGSDNLSEDFFWLRNCNIFF